MALETETARVFTTALPDNNRCRRFRERPKEDQINALKSHMQVENK
jgi:hypothetical protein